MREELWGLNLRGYHREVFIMILSPNLLEVLFGSVSAAIPTKVWVQIYL